MCLRGLGFDASVNKLKALSGSEDGFIPLLFGSMTGSIIKVYLESKFERQ